MQSKIRDFTAGELAGAPGAVRPTVSARDLVALIKPRITLMALIMAGGGYLLAPAPLDGLGLAATLLGTALAVGAANALNMYIERDSDRHMTRTRERPLPAGRMQPSIALGVGLGLQVASMGALMVWVNALTAWLGLLAFVLYVFVYTPLKRVSPWALPIGAIPGAMPALMGWTGASGSVETAGLLYALVLFLWQLPHFLAIALFRKEEYAQAGIKVAPVVYGDASARVQAVVTTALLVIVSLGLVPAGVAGGLYLAAALTLGGWFMWLGLGALRREVDATWPRRFFIASLIYLPALALALTVDVALWG